MLLSKDQQRKFWREWSAACKAQGWTKEKGWTAAQIDNERRAMIARAGFESLTLVDQVHGFTAVLRELDALRDDIGDMVQHTDEANDRRVLIFNIIEIGFPDEYIWPICRDRFGTREWQSLPLDQLKHLLQTLANRRRAKKKKEPNPF